MEIYRERKRAIFKSNMKVFSKIVGKNEAIDMFYPNTYKEKSCKVCGGKLRNYSEWHETGYEIEECKDVGCWKYETFGLSIELSVRGFSYDGKFNWIEYNKFIESIDKEVIRIKKFKRLTAKKNKTQRNKNR